MAHPLPRTDSPALLPEGAHAAAHLASIRQALRAADMIAGKGAAHLAAEPVEPLDLMQVWPELPQLHRDAFARRSQRVADRALGGLELLMAAPHPAAAERLSDDLRAGLAEVEALFEGR